MKKFTIAALLLLAAVFPILFIPLLALALVVFFVFIPYLVKHPIW
jgi:predicted membrane protein